ncbi:MAG: DNA polymerase III subunit epsilon [Alphaproteobacteria bacterium]|nr:DNA polymerase III subunit epsilon [Alphaproteobacteria bacterium]
MRHIILDTETTGFDPLQGHRIVEIGCVEMVGYIATGKTFQCYLNPEREMPEAARNVHGLSDEFLKDKPLFSQVVEEFLNFISDDPLVIHNAPFDMAFLNAELQRIGFSPLAKTRAIDTVLLARKAFPGAPASLDALCKRFKIDASTRQLHGALLDSRLLADVFVELSGGKQTGLNMEFAHDKKSKSKAEKRADKNSAVARPLRDFPLTDDERAIHEAAVASIKDNLWKKLA